MSDDDREAIAERFASLYAYVIRRCHELGVDPFVIRGKSRLREHVIVRWRIAKELREFGHSYPGIGRALNRDHSSVMQMLNGRKAATT